MEQINLKWDGVAVLFLLSSFNFEAPERGRFCQQEYLKAFDRRNDDRCGESGFLLASTLVI